MRHSEETCLLSCRGCEGGHVVLTRRFTPSSCSNSLSGVTPPCSAVCPFGPALNCCPVASTTIRSKDSGRRVRGHAYQLLFLNVRQNVNSWNFYYFAELAVNKSGQISVSKMTFRPVSSLLRVTENDILLLYSGKQVSDKELRSR